MSCTVGGSFVSTAALTFGASAMKRAICVNVSRPRRPQLIDERRSRHDLALERLLGFPRDPDVDQIDRDADRQHREQARSPEKCGREAERNIDPGIIISA